MLKLKLWVDRVATIIASIICGIFMVIIVYNVAARYFFGGGIQWYMEGSQYLNVWAMLIAGIGLCASNDHLRVSLVDVMLKGKVKTVDRVIVSLLTFAFYMLLAYSAYLLAGRARQVISTMGSLKMSYVYWMIPVTSVLSALAVLLDMVCFLAGKERDAETKETVNDHVLVD